MPTRPHTLALADLSETAAMVRGGLRESLRRKVLVVANGKGGVGKSSLCAHLAQTSAAAGKRVLLIEMDPQGNNAEDLGYIDDPSLYDHGKSQADSIITGTSIEATGEARPRLRVAPGGAHLEDVIQELYCQRKAAELTGDTTWLYMYAASIAQAAADCDLVILDVAPGSLVLQMQAMVAGDMLLVPSRSDLSSRKGLRAIAQRLNAARPYNPGLRLLGMVLFATGTRATQVQAAIREELEDDVNGQAPVFPHAIRHVEAAAVECRAAGLTAGELMLSPGLPTSLRKSATALAGDYRLLTIAVLEQIAYLKKQDMS